MNWELPDVVLLAVCVRRMSNVRGADKMVLRICPGVKMLNGAKTGNVV